jgi:hypothetical protein
MPPTNLVALAAALRDALDSPLVADSSAELEARLDILDMIPLLTRKLVGEAQVIRDMAWEVYLELFSPNRSSQSQFGGQG